MKKNFFNTIYVSLMLTILLFPSSSFSADAWCEHAPEELFYYSNQGPANIGIAIECGGIQLESGSLPNDFVRTLLGTLEAAKATNATVCIGYDSTNDWPEVIVRNYTTCPPPPF